MRRSIINRLGPVAMAGCIALGAIAFAGCGGGDDTGTTVAGASGASGASGSTPLSKDEFVSRANAICKDLNEQVQALKPPPDDPQSATAVVPFLTQGLAIARNGAAKLEALIPPSELQSQRDRLVANAKKELALTEKALAAAKANDVSEFQAVAQQLDSLDKQDDAIASSIGLTECAKHIEPQG